MEKSREVSEQAFLDKGAKYVETEDGGKELRLTEEQIEKATAENDEFGEKWRDNIRLYASNVISEDCGKMITSELFHYGFYGNCDAHERDPVFPDNNDYVGVCHYTYESSRMKSGVEMLFVVFKLPNRTLGAERIYASTPDQNVYIRLDGVKVENDVLVVDYSSGGTPGGKPWKDKKRIPMSSLRPG